MKNYVRVRRLNIFRAPVFLHWSVLVVVGGCLATAMSDPIVAVIAAVSYFSVIFVHEYGHAFVASRLGYRVQSIKLSVIHGECAYECGYEDARDTALIAWGGPLAQFAVAIAVWLIATDGWRSRRVRSVRGLSWIPRPTSSPRQSRAKSAPGWVQSVAAHFYVVARLAKSLEEEAALSCRAQDCEVTPYKVIAESKTHLMRLSLLALVIAIPGSALAADFVDPDEIGPDAPDMLVSKKLFVSCSEREFWMSINEPIKSTRPFNVPEVVEHPLTDEPLQISSSCQHGNHLIDAVLETQPPGDRGMCSASHSIRLRLRVDKKLVLSSWFANYCTGWGITSVNADSRSDQLAYLTVCGYWTVPSDLFEKGGSVKTFKCEKLPLDRMREKGLFFTDGEISQ